MLLIDPTTQNTAVGDVTTALQDFTIDCDTGVCNIQTLANDGNAKNTVRSLSGGFPTFQLRDDVTSVGTLNVQILLRDDGFLVVQLPPSTVLYEIDINGGGLGNVQFFADVLDETGTCVFGPSC